MKKFTIILTIMVLLIAGAFGLLYIQSRKVPVLQSKILYEAKTPINAAIPMGDGIVLGTADGNVLSIDLNGKTKWKANLKTDVFGISKEENGDFLVSSVAFHLLNKNGKEIFSKGLKNYIGVKGRFLTNGNIELVFQSLKDLSYEVIETDKTGKTVSTRSIPDLGESSGIAILKNGNILFSGSRGELYILDSRGIVNDAVIPNNKGILHSIYAKEFPDGNIIAGYMISTEKEVSVPIYFFDSNLKKIDTAILHSNINNVQIENGKAVFSANDGFYVFDSNGKLIKKYTKFGFSAVSCSANKNGTLLMYYKPPESKKNKPILSISLLKSGNEVAKYLFSSDNIPVVKLDTSQDTVFLIQKNRVELLYKK